MKYLKIWTSFLESVSELDDAAVGRLFRMMLAYADSGDAPWAFTGNERFLWPTAKQYIDQAAEANEKLRRNGGRGGRPLREREAQTGPDDGEDTGNRPEPDETGDIQAEPDETKDNQTKPDITNDNQTKPNVTNNNQTKPNVTKDNQTKPNETNNNQTKPNETKDNQSEPNESKQKPIKKRNEMKRNEKKEKEMKALSERERERFHPPTLEEVETICREENYHLDPVRFISFYASKGWMVGNQPMQDWHAALRAWESREWHTGRRPGAVSRPVTAQRYEQRQYTEEELAALTNNPIQRILEENDKALKARPSSQSP